MFSEDCEDRPDWKFVRDGAVTLFWKLEHLSHAKLELQKVDYEIHEIGCNLGLDHFKMRMSETLRWKEQFGYSPWTGNLDAFNEGVRFLPAPRSHRFALVLLGFHELASCDPKIAHGVLDIFEDAARYQLLLGRILVCFVQTNDNKFQCPPVGGRNPQWNRREWLDANRGL
jgi:hypothetical protein